MSAEDISRFLLDPRMRYATALMQQGRVLTDSDWNEMVGLEGLDRRQMIAETVCTAGTPNGGFQVSGLVQPFSVTTFPPGAASLVIASYNFALGNGSFYLGGYRFTIDSTVVAESFQNQSDWLTATLGAGNLPTAPTAADLAAGPRTDIVYLRGWEQSVTSIEDQEFRERALGGPDTTVRVRRMRRVQVLANATAANCGAARTALRTFLAAPRTGDTGGPHSFDATGTELLSKARLTVGFAATGTDADPCKPRTVRGFLGAENQAIRVQLTSANQFIWGIDNAAPVYRVQVDPSDATRRRLIFLTPPRDSAAMPLQGQAIELLPWDAALVNREKAAAQTGFVSAISTSYDPGANTLTLTTAVPQNMVNWLAGLPAGLENPLDPTGQRRFFYLRVWTGGAPQTFVPGTPVGLTDTGLELTFSDFGIPGDYWIIAARPNTPDLVVPWRLLDHAPPAGPREFFTVLALVRWSLVGGAVTAAIHDCRERFRSLCRNNGCCRVTVGDGQDSHGDFTSIQDAVNALPAEGGEICVLNGTFTGTVQILARQNIVIHGCGRDTIVVAPAGATTTFDIDGSRRIAIRDLTVSAPAAIGVRVRGLSEEIVLKSLRFQARDRAAIIARLRRDLVIEHCVLIADALAAELAPGVNAGLEPLIYAAGRRLRIERNRLTVTATRARLSPLGGMQIGGGSRDVEIRRNEIEAGNGNGITLGSIRYVPARDADDPVIVGGIDGSTGDGLFIPGFVFDPDNCIFVPGDPVDPTGPDGTPLVPVSEGDLVDVRIIDNRILRMGQNGIAVPRLFFPEARADLITIRRLLIVDNLIQRCMRLEVGPITPVNIYRVAFGGIILAEIELASLRDNIIEDVGTAHRDQICGIFALSAIGIAIEGCRLRRNGRVAEPEQPLKLGFRGGIILRFVMPPTEALSFSIGAADFSGRRQDGMPAAAIHGNVVVAREGRALYINGLGPMSITDNQFTAHGSDFLALLRTLIGAATGTSVTTGVTTGATALPPGVSTMDLLLDALGGNAILVFNLGWSNEIYLQILGASRPVGDAAGDDDTRWFVGGNILFCDNQVVFDALNPVFTFSLCAILLFSFDHVTMGDNQVDCDLALDFVLIDTIVLTLSTTVTNNRFKEGYYNAYLSAYVIAFLMDATRLNVGTHCIIDWGLIRPSAVATVSGGGAPAPTVDVDLRLNLSLADPTGENEDCNVFDRRRSDFNTDFDSGLATTGRPFYSSFGGGNG